MDVECLRNLRDRCRVLVTLEESSLNGGFGDGVLEELEREQLRLDGVIRMGLPDRFVAHGSRDRLLDEVGLTPRHVVGAVLRALDRERS